MAKIKLGKAKKSPLTGPRDPMKNLNKKASSRAIAAEDKLVNKQTRGSMEGLRSDMGDTFGPGVSQDPVAPSIPPTKSERVIRGAAMMDGGSTDPELEAVGGDSSMPPQYSVHDTPTATHHVISIPKRK